MSANQPPESGPGESLSDAGSHPTVPAGTPGDSGRDPTIPAGLAAEPELAVIPPSAYEIGDELARGGMGRILRARDVRLNRQVAIKELLSKTSSLRARFEREALITARLQHPAIVPIYEAGRWPSGEPFYTMKLVSGRPLDQLIGKAHTLDARIALLPNVLAMAEALAYAHSHQVVHRDLKPANVLIGEYGETVLIDWGLAKDLSSGVPEPASLPTTAGATASADVTVAGSVLGTPAYMPPEQARGEAVDERADVYAVGAVLYHLLAGRPTYEGRSSDAVLEAVLARPPVPLDELAPDAPPDLVAIVNKAIARDPEGRYRTAKELVEDLRRFQTGQLVGVHRYSAGELVRRWIRRHRAAVTVASIAVIALLGLGGFAISRVIAANQRTAEAEVDQANAELEKATSQRAAALRAQQVAEQAEKDIELDRDRHLFMRKRRIAMNHFAHTQKAKCSACHKVDPVTLLAVANAPGHRECQPCHEVTDNKRCTKCHQERPHTSKRAIRTCEARPQSPYEEEAPATKPTGKPCFRHELPQHRSKDGVIVECGECHFMVGDDKTWGSGGSYKTLDDLATHSLIVPGETTDPHRACAGCHPQVELANTGSDGGSCGYCHDEIDNQPF